MNTCKKCGKEIDENIELCEECNIEKNDEESINESENVMDEEIVQNLSEEQPEEFSTSIIESVKNEEAFEGQVVYEGSQQPVSTEQLELIEKLKQQKIKKEKREELSRGAKIAFNILWIIFGGLWTAITFTISGVLECITLIGIPFGIVLFKLVPLVFMPLGKRIKTSYGSHPILNTLWLLFGGFFIALSYTIYTLFLFITIIGIPIALQTSKICQVLWVPFGAKVLEEDEFSDVEIERNAYTIQHVRKNRIYLQSEKYNFNQKEHEIIQKLCDLNTPIGKAIRSESKSNRVVSIIITVICGLFGFYALKFGGVLVNYAISKVLPSNIIDKIFTAIDSSSATPILAALVLLLFVFIIIVGIGKSAGSNKALDYGYATRKELANFYDSGVRIPRKTKDLIFVLYKMYEKEILAEIVRDRK